MSRGIHVDYNRTFYRPYTLRQSALVYLSHMPPNVDTIMSCGNSGCSIASAMLTLTSARVAHVCIRKSSEVGRSHSSMSGYYLNKLIQKKAKKIVIVDDFISSGETIKRILHALDEELLPRVACILVNSGRDMDNGFQYKGFTIPIIEARTKKRESNATTRQLRNKSKRSPNSINVPKATAVEDWNRCCEATIKATSRGY